MSEIPVKASNEVMFWCKGHCCLCGKWGVQIHHIDGNHDNHDIDNLIPLCPTCHSDVSSSSPLVRKMPIKVLKGLREKFYYEIHERAIANMVGESGQIIIKEEKL